MKKDVDTVYLVFCLMMYFSTWPKYIPSCYAWGC